MRVSIHNVEQFPMDEKCRRCNGACCRYVALEIDKPETKRDFDDIRWYLAHRGVSVFVEEGRWYINFRTRCKYLTKDFRCAIYERRPRICREHKTSECEFGSDSYDFEYEFKTVEDIERYYEEHVRKKTRKKKTTLTTKTAKKKLKSSKRTVTGSKSKKPKKS